MPAPLQGSLERVRPALVVAAILPSFALGGNAQFTSRLSRPEDTTRPARPAVVVQQPVPVPGASSWMPRPLAPNVDPLRPIEIVSGQQPIPGPSFWAPTPARLPNTDPLRPIIVQAEPPDASLALPSVAWVGRLPRGEDTSRPARPAAVSGPSVPVPGAQVVQTYAPRDTAVAPELRLAPSAVVQEPPDATLALSNTTWIGRLARGEDINWLARRAIVSGPSVPIPGAMAALLGWPREAPAVQPDRVLPPLIIGAVPQPPRALVIQLAAPRDGAAPAGRPLVVVRPAQQPPGACAVWVGMLRRAEANRPGQPPIVWVPPRAMDGAITIWSPLPFDETQPPAPTPIICAVAELTQQAKPLAVLLIELKPVAVVVPAVRLATLTQEAKPLAVLTQALKPIAILEQCRG